MIVTAKELAILKRASHKMHNEYRRAAEPYRPPGNVIGSRECWAEVEALDYLIEEATVSAGGRPGEGTPP